MATTMGFHVHGEKAMPSYWVLTIQFIYCDIWHQASLFAQQVNEVEVAVGNVITVGSAGFRRD